MQTPWESNIVRITTGKLNTVNDSVIGGGGTGASGNSKYSGQLGKRHWVGPEQIGQMFSSAVGTLYAGCYQYIRTRAADDDSPAITVGKLMFWDTTLTNWQTLYQVTRDENLSSVANAVMMAGVYIGSPTTQGNYGFIQVEGLVNVRCRAVLTAAGAIGSPVYATATGDTGSDQGTVDVLTTDSTAVANQRFLGTAVTAPAGGALCTILLRFTNFLT